MTMTKAPPKDIDAYIAGFPPEVRAILERIRRTGRAAAPEAEEKISYRMPSTSPPFSTTSASIRR